MRVPHFVLPALAALSIALIGGGALVGFAEEAPPTHAPVPAERLRYIGRDPFTGRPAMVNDRYIADMEYAIARYGKDAGEPVPAPPADGADIVAIAAPAIGVDAPVERFGLDAYGRLDVPQDRVHVGWNPAFTALPGEGESTFLAAHYEYGGLPGVFFRLSDLVSGDEIAITLSDGTVHRYRVTSVVDYHLAAIDMGALLQGREGVESITLMTCSGPPTPDGYQWRTVVLAEKAD